MAVLLNIDRKCMFGLPSGTTVIIIGNYFGRNIQQIPSPAILDGNLFILSGHFVTSIVSSTLHGGSAVMNYREGPLYYCQKIPYMSRDASFYNIKMHMIVFPHRKTICAVANISEELVSIREDAFVRSVKADDGKLHTSDVCTDPKGAPSAELYGTNSN